MSEKQDDEATVEVRPGVLEGINGEYRITGGQLGDGQQAIVSRACDIKTGNICVIKKSFRKERACKNEIMMLRSFSHTSIVRYIDHDPAHTFVAVELVEGGDLEEQHDVRPFTHREVENMTLDMLEALAYVHASDVIHHDIKPANILVKLRTADKLVIKLIDFGLSSRGPHSRRRVGSPFYAAPELFLPDVSSVPWTGKIDVWSLGLVGLKFLWGLPQPPQYTANGFGFQPNNPHANGWRGAIRTRIKHVLKNEILSSVTPGLLVTLFTMLEINPEQRFCAQKALEHMRKHSELGYIPSQGMDLEEQPNLLQEEDGVQ